MLVVSPDGSYSAFNDEFGEHYSCVSQGAFSEKIAKHIVPAFAFLGVDLDTKSRTKHNLKATQSNILQSKIESRAESTNDLTKAEIWILDICFGLGYNAILSATLLAKFGIKTHIISLECDKNTLNLAQKIHNLDSSVLESLSNGKQVIFSQQGITTHNAKSTTQAQEAVTLQIIWGDAKENLASIARAYLLGDMSAKFGSEFGKFGGFDIIYQDPFSSDKNPKLWSKEHFLHLFALAKSHCLITTYATKKNIICNAKEAGFLAYKYQVRDILHWILGLQECYLEQQYVQITHLDSTKSFRQSSLFSKIPLDFDNIKVL